MQYPETVNIIDLAPAPFNCAKDAIIYAKSHGIVGVMSNADTNGKGEVSISLTSLDKMLSGSAVEKSATPALHYAALVRLRDIIRESFIAEVHPDYIKGPDGKRSPTNGINPMVEIAILYGCAAYMDYPCRVKTTLKIHADTHQPTKAYSYEITNVEVLRGNAESVIRPSNNTSTFDVSILLNGVCDVNGVPLLKYDERIARHEAAHFVIAWAIGNPSRFVDIRPETQEENVLGNAKGCSIDYFTDILASLAGPVADYWEHDNLQLLENCKTEIDAVLEDYKDNNPYHSTESDWKSAINSLLHLGVNILDPKQLKDTLLLFLGTVRSTLKLCEAEWKEATEHLVQHGQIGCVGDRGQGAAYFLDRWSDAFGNPPKSVLATIEDCRTNASRLTADVV